MKEKIVIDNLKRIDDAPKQGYVLAYFTDKVWFEEYEALENVKAELEAHKMHGLLELHLFDAEKEYRCVFSRIRKGEYGVIEHVAKDFPNAEKDDVYAETICLENVDETITILNHIHYSDETGMAVVDDYRLVMGDFDANI